MIAMRIFFIASIITIYGATFNFQEINSRSREISLEYALPVNFYNIAAGYLKQLAAEMLFIKTSVFIGGLRAGTPPIRYGESLGNNFEVMTQLYPEFIAPYYYCQSFLTPISHETAEKASGIFERGIAVYPKDFVLHFFHGSNFFLSMNEPLKGAKAFHDAAQIPGAPAIFAHLAALLSAQGGDIAAGLISLKAMLASEKDEAVRIRYEAEVSIFEQALTVQNALKSYVGKYGFAPSFLDNLVPEFIPSIPQDTDSFVFVYTPPNLHLQRPDRKMK